MRLNGWTAGAAALVLAAGCARAPLPLNDAEKAAIADSVSRMATQMMASMAAPATAAAADKFLSYYVRGEALVHAQYGTIFPTYDSLVAGVRMMFPPGSTYKLTLDQRRVTVLDRDVAVLTAMMNGVYADSAGKETPIREAWTAVFHRTADGWKIAADHESVAPPLPQSATARRRSR